MIVMLSMNRWWDFGADAYVVCAFHQWFLTKAYRDVHSEHQQARTTDS